jgi:hypothetical protein
MRSTIIALILAMTICLVISSAVVQETPETKTGRQLKSGSATSTRYWDCSGGACGCGFNSNGKPEICHSNGMYAAPQGNQWGAKFYGTAAISGALGGGNWLAEGCGRCFKVSANGSTVVLKGTNYCPDANIICSSTLPHFDISAPGFDYPGASISNSCRDVEPTISALHPPQVCSYWQGGDCNCEALQRPTLVQGCRNFLSLNWNNPRVDYQELSECPQELKTTPPCWAQNGNNWPNSSPQQCSNFPNRSFLETLE